MNEDESTTRQHREMTMVCQVLLALAKSIGIDDGELYERLRQRANERDGQEQIDRIKERSRMDKLAALRTIPTPRRRYGVEAQSDGSSWGKNAERDRILGGGQAARHMEMAKIGQVFCGDGSDAHLDTRPIREEMYSTLEGTE